jgi:hypothetical protein
MPSPPAALAITPLSPSRRANVRRLERENAALRTQLAAAEKRAAQAEAECKKQIAHNKLGYQRIGELQNLVNSKSKPRKKGIALDDPVVTNDKGRAALAAIETSRNEKKVEKAQRTALREAAKDKKVAERAAMSDAEFFKVSLPIFKFLYFN